MSTVKLLQIRTAENFAIITLKFQQGGLSIRVIGPKAVDGMATSLDSDQTVPLGAV